MSHFAAPQALTHRQKSPTSSLQRVVRLSTSNLDSRRNPSHDLFNRAGYTMLTVRCGYGPSAFPQLSRGIPHDKRLSREFEHLYIVEIVTNGHDLFARNVTVICPPFERMTLGAAPI